MKVSGRMDNNTERVKFLIKAITTYNMEYGTEDSLID